MYRYQHEPQEAFYKPVYYKPVSYDNTNSYNGTDNFNAPDVYKAYYEAESYNDGNNTDAPHAYAADYEADTHYVNNAKDFEWDKTTWSNLPSPIAKDRTYIWEELYPSYCDHPFDIAPSVKYSYASNTKYMHLPWNNNTMSAHLPSDDTKPKHPLFDIIKYIEYLDALSDEEVTQLSRRPQTRIEELETEDNKENDKADTISNVTLPPLPPFNQHLLCQNHLLAITANPWTRHYAPDPLA